MLPQTTSTCGAPVSKQPIIVASLKPAWWKQATTVSAASSAQATSKPPLVWGSHSKRWLQEGSGELKLTPCP